MFHSPKRGVMSATQQAGRALWYVRFIPLNGASCLQPWRQRWPSSTLSFIPLNGASCLQQSKRSRH